MSKTTHNFTLTVLLDKLILDKENRKNMYNAVSTEQINNVKQLVERLLSEINDIKELNDADKEQIKSLVKIVESQMETGKVDQGIVAILNEKLQNISNLFEAGSFLNSTIDTFMNLLK